MVIRSPIPDLVIPEVNFDQYILDSIERNGNLNGLAIIDADCVDGKTTFTFKQARQSMLECGSALVGLGVVKGDVIAMCCSNCAQYPFLMVGSSACGAVMVTCNPMYTKDELMHQMRQTSPKVVFVNDSTCEKVEEIAKEVTSIKHIVCFERGTKHQSFSDFLEAGKSFAYPSTRNVALDDLTLILYSSGTTGLPKGVMFTHRTLVSLMSLCKATFRFSRLDTNYMVIPMFHIYGFCMTLGGLSQGAKSLIKRRFDFKQMLEDVQTYQITTMTLAPPILVGLNQLPPTVGKKIFSSVLEIGSGGAPLAEGVATALAKNLGVRIKQAWGLTEIAPATCHLDINTPISSVGIVSPNTLIKVVDGETGKELGPNQNGELWVKGPQMMAGYYKNPKATTDTVDRDGWLHTGDIGYYDDNQYFYIVDRLKELIKYKAFQVAPAELEEALLRHHLIVDAGVIGVPDLAAGELPKAFVVRKDESLTAEQIHDFLKGKVSKFKYLRGGITFVQEIPKSPSGKILRRLLRDRDIESNNIPKSKF